LFLALSFGTPYSWYATCLPSFSFILAAVTGGPFVVPHILGGGGLIGSKINPANKTNKGIAASLLTIPEEEEEGGGLFLLLVESTIVCVCIFSGIVWFLLRSV